MTIDERLRYEMFLRVRDFGAAHRHEFPDESMGGKAFRDVEEAIAEVEARATEKILTAREGKQAREAARAALIERLTTISRTARLMSKSVPGSDAVFQLPEYTSDLDLIAVARAYVREGQAAIDRFVLLGMPKTFVNDLQGLVDAFEQAVHGRRVGKAGAAAARAGLKAAIAKGMDAVRTLNIVVSNTLQHDQVALAAWKRQRRLDPRKAARTSAVAPAASSPVATPAEPVQPPAPAASPTESPDAPAPPAGAPASDDLERRAS